MVLIHATPAYELRGEKNIHPLGACVHASFTNDVKLSAQKLPNDVRNLCRTQKDCMSSALALKKTPVKKETQAPIFGQKNTT